MPDLIKKDTTRPAVITDFRIDNRTIRPDASQDDAPLKAPIERTRHITLRPGQNTIGFGFSSLSYPMPGNIRYRYRLDGIDDKWHVTDSRNAMLRAMVTYLFENGKIETTVTRAKEVRSMAEKMVTLGKKEDLHSKRQVFSYITKETVAKKVIDEYGPKYADRNGGYTRIIKIGARRGDAAEMAIIELV